MSYIIHGIRIIKIAFRLIFLGLAGMIHALLPFIFLATVSAGVNKINQEISQF